MRKEIEKMYRLILRNPKMYCSRNVFEHINMYLTKQL